jgi:protein-S-isoprenylcysteine O-methyltransferase
MALLMGILAGVCTPFADGPSELMCTSILGGMLWVSLLLPDLTRRSGLTDILCIIGGSLGLGLSVGISVSRPSYYLVYCALLSMFHYSEFVLPVVSGQRPSFDLLLLNHGKEYSGAFTIAVLEYFISPMHLPWTVQSIGLMVSLVGLLLRMSALLTAGTKFTHSIATRRSLGHNLVTWGPYRLMRHPGYSGWFVWVVGAQLLIGNIVSLIGFTIVSYMFFKWRIPFEEGLLTDFFGDEYEQYKKDTPFSGIPYI